MLPNDTFLGKLEYHNVYMSYDMPRIFSVKNKADNYYLVYWSEEENDHDVWLYVSISPEKLKQVEKGVIRLKDVFLYPELETVLKLKEYFEPKTNTELEYIEPSKLTDDVLPLDDYYINEVDENFQTYSDDGKVSKINPDSLHELHIERASASKRVLPKLSQVSFVLDHYQKFYNSINESLGENDDLVSISSRAASHISKLSSNNFPKSSKVIMELFKRINKGDSLEPFITKNRLNPRTIHNLLASLAKFKFDLTIQPLSGNQDRHSIDISSARDALFELQALATVYLGSRDIPQANSLEKVFDVIKYKKQRVENLAITMSIEPRQVQYYEDAAYILGYLDNFKSLTSSGFQISQLSSLEEKLEYTIGKFENSKVGWAWIHWSNGITLKDIDPNTAEDFLQEVGHGLSENTSRRRAKTIKVWAAELQKYLSDEKSM